MLKVGDFIAHFSLPDQDGDIHTDQDYLGKWLLVYFYPKDDTPGCTAEACGFRDHFSQLKQQGIEVVGISKDPVKSHRKFVKKYELPFTLLADPELVTIKSFGAHIKKTFYGIERDWTKRVSFLIDPKGVVKKVYPDVDSSPEKHAEEVLIDWHALTNE
jgi:peroxiredoxin Q/BCP